MTCTLDITICTGPGNPNAPPNATGDCKKQMDAILHEIKHAQQACSVYGICNTPWIPFKKKWNNEKNRICREVDAYCSEFPSLCPGGVPTPTAILTTICPKACDSVPDISNCLTKCQKIAANCATGIYTPPPPTPKYPWYLPPPDVIPWIPILLPPIPVGETGQVVIPH